MTNKNLFPFSAIVRQELMKQALILNAIDNRIGGVLISGERGTAKSTAARALAALLPSIKVNQGCRFHCDPELPNSWCTECQERIKNGENIPIVEIPTPFVNLPVSATEDRVVGTLDIEKAIQKGIRAFEPGVLAEANRGLLYIDEVNLLDDHVVDVLLDAAAMGVNIVEREGISFQHPARFMLVGTMNPEEGELRPQLLDRFGLSVEIHGIHSVLDRVAIIERSLEFENNTEEFRKKWAEKDQHLSDKIQNARQILSNVTYSGTILNLIADISTRLEVDGHRGDLVILKTAKANAAFNTRTQILFEDVGIAANMALAHRMKNNPFDPNLDASDFMHQINNLIEDFICGDCLECKSMEMEEMSV